MEMNYYYERRPIGLWVLFNSLKEQQSEFGWDTKKLDTFTIHLLQIVSDWNFILISLQRLRNSIESNDRWKIAVDATSFFLFVRIYYDSLASLTHFLFRMANLSDSRRWPKKQSFSDQLKWFAKTDDPYFTEFKQALKDHSFEHDFKMMKTIRDRLKSIPQPDEVRRLTWIRKEDLQTTGDLRTEVGHHFYKVLNYSDFLGDIMLLKLSQVFPLQRMDQDHHGYDAGFLPDEHIDLYQWFNLPTKEFNKRYS